MKMNEKRFRKELEQIEQFFEEGFIDIRFEIDGEKRKSVTLGSYIEVIDFNIAESPTSHKITDLDTNELYDKLILDLARKMKLNKFGTLKHLKSIGEGF